MQTPIDFGKEFLNRLYDQRDADACMGMLAGDLVWITPEDMHHFLSEGAVLRFLRRKIAADEEPRYVDLISIKSSPSADNIMTVAYEVNLVSREDERPLYLRCSMAICRRGKRLEITFLHFSKKSERDSTERLRDFVTNLPCGVMILACLEGRREEAIYYNDYFAHRLRYRQEEFAQAIRRNPFFMASEEDRDRIHEEITQARKNGGSIAVSMRFFRRDGNCFYYRMKGAPAYQANGGTVYYCVFQETTGFQLNTERLQARLDAATEAIRQVPEAICGIEYPAGSRFFEELAEKYAGKTEPGGEAAEAAGTAAAGERDVRTGSADEDIRIRRADGDIRTGKAGNFRKKGEKTARVIFTSKNIPTLFGISNSAYISNVLEDPFFGLEITSITRGRLLSSHVFNPEKTCTGKPVVCGIFRLQKPDGKSLRVELVARRVQDKDGTMRLYLFYYDREAQQQEMENRVERASKMGRGAMEQLRADLKKTKESAARRQSELKGELKEARKKHSEEITRIEDQLAEEKKRCVLMARQLEDSRATQKKMATELGMAEADALKRIHNFQERSERKVAEAEKSAARTRKNADESIRKAKAAAEEKIREVKKNAGDMVREAKEIAAEEAARSQKAAEEKIREAAALAEKADRTQQEAEERIRRAEDGRSLMEEQLREAQERSRVLENQLKNERARRQLLEEQIRSGGKSIPERLQDDAEGKTDSVGRAALIGTAPVIAAGTVMQAAAAAGMIGAPAITGSISEPSGAAAELSAGMIGTGSGTSVSGAERISGTQESQSSFTVTAHNYKSAGGREQMTDHYRPGDWMTTEDPLTVFSSMDPVQPEDSRKTPAQAETAPKAAAQAETALKAAAQEEIVSKAAAQAEIASKAAAQAETVPKAAAQAETALKTTAQPEAENRTAVLSESESVNQSRQKSAKARNNVAGEGTFFRENKAGEPILKATFRGTDSPKKQRDASGETVLQEAFTMENSSGGFTPEELGAAAENRIRAQEYDKAKERLRSLLEMTESFLHDTDKNGEQTNPQRSAGARKILPGFTERCSRENIGTVMNDFLEAASPAIGLLQGRPFSPEECLRNVLIYEGMMCEKKGIVLRSIRDSGLPETVTGFGTMLQRALCELIEQAISHTRAGGTITVHSRADRPSGGLVNLYFRIDDNGTGLSEREMQTLFEAETPPENGRLFRSGLFSTREAATLMGGSIHARSSRLGNSFLMEVTLPTQE